MNIRDMFFKEIDRDIKGVIKVGQSDDENIFQELDEYVVTSELEKYMDRFFAAYKRGVESRTDKMGVWISGFFGSGKSHFLKILSYILSNKVVMDDKGQSHAASSFFLEGVKVENESLKKKISEVSGWSDDVDVILFNIDSKSATDSKMNKEAVKDVFMKVFNDYLGYCGSIPFLADFERKLDNDGRYEEFKTKFEEINGSSWVESREDFYFIQDEIMETVVSLGIMSENEARNWTENAQSSYSLSIDKFAEYIRKYCESKGKDHHVLFLVDEIGQYIADDSKLMLNLQTVTEDLGTACKGNAWIIVTSQQDIDSITKTMGEDFSKIQGRFDTRIALSSANVDEVIRKRILYKKDTATVILKDLYGSHEFDIKGNITFSEGTPEMPLYADADEFAEVYPFIPYQFKLLGNVLTSVRQYSSSGKHLADGERSMLALFKEAAQKYENEREGVLVPFHAFYSALDDFIDHTHRIVITQAVRNSRLNSFDVELLKVLFMIKHVNNFSKNLENITTLMISNMNEDRLDLGKKVEASLRVLCDELLVQKNGNEYIFLTNEEQEAEDAIRKINIDPTETVNYVAQVAFEEIIAMVNNKYRYNNRYQFSFNQKIDNRQYKSNQLSNITLHLLTAYSGEIDDLALSLKAATEKSVIVRLSDDYAYLSETEEMKKIESFLQRPDLASLNDYEIISATKRKERNDKAKRIKDYIRMALETADIYVGDGKIATKSKDVTARINEAFAKLIASEYSKLKDMTSEPAQSDILDVLKKNKTQMTLDFGDMAEPNADALKEMIAAIQYAGRTGAKFSIKQAFDKFMAAPYGYVEEDIEFLIATLYKKGQISLKMNSVIYSPASTSAEDAYKFITKREYREKILLEMKETPKTQWVKAVKDVIRDFFCRSVVSDDADALMRDFRNYGSSKKAVIEDILRSDYSRDSRLPGKAVLEKAVRLIDDTCNISDPMTFYRRVDELFDDFDETSVELGDLNTFLGGVQKEKFIKACRTLAFYEASKNYISAAEIIENANQVKKIISLQKPYSFIPKLEQYEKMLGEAIVALLEEDAKRIEPDIYADRKLVMDSIEDDRPYAAALKKKLGDKFDELIEKLYTCKDIASLNGIPSESNALLQNSLDELKKTEHAYQLSIMPKEPADGGEKPATPVAPPVKVINTVPVTMRTLTGNRTYTFRTETEIDEFVEEIRKNLKSILGADTVIKLS
jgi:hypothetical protein